MRNGVVLLVVAATGCGGDDDATLSVETGELAVEQTIDGESTFWATAPVLIEGPFACPLPAAVFEPPIASAHEAFVIENVGAATSLDIQIEGSSFDAGLTAEPLLIVYAGATVPDQAIDAANCLGIAKPGGGEPGSVTIPVATGDVLTAVALEYEIGPGFDGSGSGTFRLRVTPTL